MDESEGGFLLYSENIEPPIPTIVVCLVKWEDIEQKPRFFAIVHIIAFLQKVFSINTLLLLLCVRAKWVGWLPFICIVISIL